MTAKTSIEATPNHRMNPDPNTTVALKNIKPKNVCMATVIQGGRAPVRHSHHTSTIQTAVNT